MSYKATTTLQPGLRVRHKVADRTGILLSPTDPKLWENTTQFPMSNPDIEAIQHHVEACYDRGLLLDTVPVLWDNGICYWHKPKLLQPLSS